MSVELWFLLTLGLAQLYDARAGHEFEAMSTGRKFGLGMAAIAAAGIALVGLLLYHVDFTHVHGVREAGSAYVLLGGYISYRTSLLGLQYWLRSVWWRRTASAGVAAFLTVCFFAKPNFALPSFFNNILLVFFAIGLGSLVGHWVSKRFAYFFYTLLMVFDVYAVWCSNIMSTMITRAPNVVPTGFLIMGSMPWKDFLGVGDVIFGVIGIIILRVYTSWRWALAASLLYVLTIWTPCMILVARFIPASWADSLMLFPVMVTICPITMVCLWLGSRGRSQS